MFNIEKFIKLRKSKNLSQTQLCQGICTQATLSKFENEARPPSIKILSQLCERLEILPADIMIRSNETPVAKKLHEAEIACISSNFTTAYNMLISIDQDELSRSEDITLFNLIIGVYALTCNQDQVKALFHFNIILNNSKISSDNIYYLLAITGCAMTYEERRDYDKAKKYYAKLTDSIIKVKIDSKECLFQVLWILYQTGEFYGKHNNFKESNYLLRYAYQIGSQHNETFLMEKILYRLGLNMIAKSSKDIAVQYLNDARAFARFSHNQYILNKTRQALNELKE